MGAGRNWKLFSWSQKEQGPLKCHGDCGGGGSGGSGGGGVCSVTFRDVISLGWRNSCELPHDMPHSPQSFPTQTFAMFRSIYSAKILHLPPWPASATADQYPPVGWGVLGVLVYFFFNLSPHYLSGNMWDRLWWGRPPGAALSLCSAAAAARDISNARRQSVRGYAVCITSDNIPSAELVCEFRCQWFLLLLISRQQFLCAATTRPGQLEDKIGLNEQKLNKPEFSNLNCCVSLQSTDEFSRTENFSHVYYCKTCVIRL